MKKQLLKTVYSVTNYMFFILMFGSVFNSIPLLGDVSTSIAGSLIHIWIIFGIILFIISLLFLKENNDNLSIINTIVNSISLAMCIFILIRIIYSFNVQDLNVSMFKTYFKQNVSEVKTEYREYKDEEGNEFPLNLYYLDELNDKPIIVYIHGGGWIEGSENDNEYTSKVLAMNGYNIVSVGYELSNDEKHLWDKNEKQILYALAWVSQNLKVDSIYMIGDSAGGNIVLNIAYKINDKTYSDINGMILPTVNAISVNYPVTNPTSFYYNDSSMSKEISKTMVTRYIGGTPEEYPQRYEEISPEKHISENIPPTFIIVGENDALVPPESTYGFIEKLNEKGIKNKLVTVPYFGHAGDKYDNNLFNQAYINQTLEWFKIKN
ncbi:MAG: alpha/beta hydrolase fold domain-containing protein [Clostridia bacterium]|nr:alpha/beta hydrolase fold domain-containing protein [Clostridia bacterium]